MTDNFYETAVACFRKAITTLESTGAQYNQDPLVDLARGMTCLAQGLLQHQQQVEQRLAEIAKALQPPK